MSKKDIIYQSGTTVIATKGFFNTKVQDIVEDANVSVGTFYNYYNDKNHFYYCIFFEEYSNILHKLKEIYSQKISQVEMLILFFDFLLNEFNINTSAMMVLICGKKYITKVFDGESYGKIQDLLNEIAKLLFLIISEGQEKKLIKETDPCFIITLFESFFIDYSINSDPKSAALDKDGLKDFILDSITPKGGV